MMVVAMRGGGGGLNRHGCEARCEIDLHLLRVRLDLRLGVLTLRATDTMRRVSRAR
jgi:hypothetical protein